MSILRTHNLQNPDSSSINIVMDQGGNTNITGVTTVGSNLKVGIGEDSPVSRLHLANSGSGNVSMTITNDTTGHTSGNGVEIGMGGEEQAQIWNYENSYFRVGTSNEERLRITSSGDVGVGTDNPSASLDVVSNHASAYIAEFRQSNASNTGQIIIDSPSDGDSRPSYMDYATGGSVKWTTGLAYNDTHRSFHIGTGSGLSNSKLTIKPNGTTGIGTDNPTDKLHVYSSNGNTVSTIDSVGNDAALQLRNSGNGNWSGINFIRERSTGTNVTGGSIWMPSDTANNSALLYIQTQSASANAGADGALTDNNGVRLKLASQPNGSGPNSAFTVEVGSTEKFRVSAGGIITTPNQPAFNARGFPSHRYMDTWQNVDLDDWNYLDQNGSHFDNSTGRFTAPVAGKYFFIFTSMYTNPSTGDFHNYLMKNGSTFVQSNNHSGGGSSNGHTWNDCTIQAVIPLAANDYVTARCTGSNQNNLYLYGSSTSSLYNCFCGFLIG